jgi:hypothetical protein
MKFFKAIYAWGLSIWRRFPPYVQAGIVVFASTAASFLGDRLWDGASCWTWACLKHTVGAACGAGFVALKAFYARPGKGPHPGETPYTGS